MLLDCLAFKCLLGCCSRWPNTCCGWLLQPAANYSKNQNIDMLWLVVAAGCLRVMLLWCTDCCFELIKLEAYPPQHLAIGFALICIDVPSNGSCCRIELCLRIKCETL